MSEFGELEAADAYCRLMANRHYENFSVASRLLPPRLRQDLARVYAYCRLTDDLGDESGAGAAARLQRWQTEVGEMFEGGHPIHPVLVALRETVTRHELQAQPFLDLIQANLQDQEVRSYDTWPALVAYCMLSAAPVGRIVLRLFGLEAPAAERLSDDVCVGLQVANFAQDVSLDRAKGRRYLLGPEVEAGGTAGAVRAHCARARSLLESGEELEKLARGRLRLQLKLYRLGGLAILDSIERAGFETDRVRPRVSMVARAAIVLKAGGGNVRSARTA
jgi:squalene synthase HpnC